MASLDKYEKRFIAFALLFLVLALTPFLMSKERSSNPHHPLPSEQYPALVVRADTWERLESIASR